MFSRASDKTYSGFFRGAGKWVILIFLALLVGLFALRHHLRSKGWQVFSSPAGGFSVLFPKAPEEKVTVQKNTGREITAHTFSAETTDHTYYAVVYFDCPPSVASKDPEVIFKKSQEDAIGKSGTLVFERQMKFQNYPAREYEFREGGKANFSMRVRMFLVGRRYYQLAILFITKNPHPTEQVLFLNSFLLLQPP